MNEEEQKKYNEMEAQVEASKTKFEELESSSSKNKEDFEKTIAEKDVLIKQKTDDIVGARKKYKKVGDLTAEEREAFTEKELELQQRNEDLEARQVKFEKSQAEVTQREVDARIDASVKSFAGDDKELAEKIRANYGRLSDSGKAQTAEEVTASMTDAYNMLGIPKGDGVASVVADGDGGSAGGGSKQDFSDTSAGKELASALNLNQAK